MPDYALPWELVSDACGYAIGAVLLQRGKPVAFAARSLTKAEQDYSATEQELLGCIYALQQWRCFLEGVKADMFTLVTDHHPLTYLQTEANLSRKQARWSEYLQRFTFRWQYRPGRLIAVDGVSRMPQLADHQIAVITHTAIVVFVDRLSKMTHFAATKDSVDSQGLAQLMIDDVVRFHGVPAEMVSDRDTRMTSEFAREFYALLKVPRHMSTAFHPQTDGQTERINRVVEEMLRAFVAPSLDDWDQHLSMCEFAINSAENESVKSLPFKLLYGSNLRVPATVDFETAQSQAAGEAPPAPTAQVGQSSAARTFAQVTESIQHARRCMVQAQQRQKAYADQHRRDLEFPVGDRVLLSTKHMRRPGAGRCLLPRFIGPHKVAKRVGAVAYELDIPRSMRIHDVFHFSLLKPYRSDGRVQPPPVTIMMALRSLRSRR